MKITSVYTKTGDNGTTSLVGGARVKKTNLRIEAYGTVDELSANLGLLASWMKDGHDKSLIEHIQNELFVVCSYLATDQTKTELRDSCKIDPSEITLLENEIDKIQASTPPVNGFVLPGGSHQAAQAHVCRTVCRRAERRVLLMGEKAKVSSIIIQYINRLSDYLYVLARKLNFLDGIREKIWQKSL